MAAMAAPIRRFLLLRYPRGGRLYVSTAPRIRLSETFREHQAKYILNMVASEEVDNWALYFDGCTTCGYDGGALELIDLFAASRP